MRTDKQVRSSATTLPPHQRSGTATGRFVAGTDKRAAAEARNEPPYTSPVDCSSPCSTPWSVPEPPTSSPGAHPRAPRPGAATSPDRRSRRRYSPVPRRIGPGSRGKGQGARELALLGLAPCAPSISSPSSPSTVEGLWERAVRIPCTTPTVRVASIPNLAGLTTAPRSTQARRSGGAARRAMRRRRPTEPEEGRRAGWHDPARRTRGRAGVLRRIPYEARRMSSRAPTEIRSPTMTMAAPRSTRKNISS